MPAIAVKGACHQCILAAVLGHLEWLVYCTKHPGSTNPINFHNLILLEKD
jgi:hypothetical protein